MKRFFALLCASAVLLMATGCETKQINITVSADETSVLSGNTFGKSALIEIGDSLWYDSTTRIVYWWNGLISTNSMDIKYSDTTPAPYYAPNGLPYRYNPETSSFEMIAND